MPAQNVTILPVSNSNNKKYKLNLTKERNFFHLSSTLYRTESSVVFHDCTTWWQTWRVCRVESNWIISRAMVFEETHARSFWDMFSVYFLIMWTFSLLVLSEVWTLYVANTLIIMMSMFVRKINGKPRNFNAYFCGSLYSTFKTSY